MIALERDESATALVQRVMSDWIESYDAEKKLRAGTATLRVNHNAPKPIARVVSVETTADGHVTVEALPWDESRRITDVKLDHVSVDTRTPQMVRDQAEALSKAAELAAAKGKEFHPVPKPVRKPRTRR